MPEVVWRERATRHLNELYVYLHQRNPRAAERYANGLRTACAGLGHFPERAKRINVRYRALVYRNHLAIYHYDRELDRVFIVAVIHAQREVQPLLRWLTD